MAIDIQKYLAEQYQRSLQKGKMPGPVVTISREYGCAAKAIAEVLSDKLNHVNKTANDAAKWTWINKEIFEGTAKALNLKASRVSHVFEGEKKNFIESAILSASEKYYTSDDKIKKKIIEIVRSYAEQGHFIIIGLGSVAITRDIPKSLHIKLYAPLEWRAKRMAEKLSKSYDEMLKETKSIDKKREMLRDSFNIKAKPEELFDVMFNVMNMKTDEITHSIIEVMKVRKLI